MQCVCAGHTGVVHAPSVYILWTLDILDHCPTKHMQSAIYECYNTTLLVIWPLGLYYKASLITIWNL